MDAARGAAVVSGSCIPGRVGRGHRQWRASATRDGLSMPRAAGSVAHGGRRVTTMEKPGGVAVGASDDALERDNGRQAHSASTIGLARRVPAAFYFSSSGSLGHGGTSSRLRAVFARVSRGTSEISRSPLSSCALAIRCPHSTSKIHGDARRRLFPRPLEPFPSSSSAPAACLPAP
jgi:hypothetical protein